jgi:hypothetical protein
LLNKYECNANRPMSLSLSREFPPVIRRNESPIAMVMAQ